MPRLSEFSGIVVYMYWRDRAPPPFHALHGGEEAQILISDGSILAGSLPRTAPKLVAEGPGSTTTSPWSNWGRAQAPATLVPIEGLR